MMDEQSRRVPAGGCYCPFCGSEDTELFSLFGRQLLTVQYYCNTCHTPFDRVKGDDVIADASAWARDSGREP